MESVVLKPIGKSDHRFLYDLLKNRDKLANISHRKMPSYEEHVRFVLSKPYQIWYIVKLGNDKIGSVYLTHNDEIGISLTKDMQGKGIGKLALTILMEKNPRKRYLANINPKNKKSIKFFKSEGFKLIQHTYELLKK
jgi:RimJ/RimL family protein N-acetyltransferase